MRVVALVLVFAVGAFAACESDPDHTNEQIFYQSCNAGEALVVNSLAVNKDDGSTNYPVDVDHPIDIVLNLTNTASTSFDNIFIVASIARYTDIFGFCSWIGIPTFGLLDHLDACSIGETKICPLPPGVLVIKDRIDLHQFQAIINILSTSEPYQLKLQFKSGNTELTCATIETKIKKG